MNYKQQLAEIRRALVERIKALWPKEQEYVNISVRDCAGIKYLLPDYELGLYNDSPVRQLAPHSIEEMPIEALAELLDHLAK